MLYSGKRRALALLTLLVFLFVVSGCSPAPAAGSGGTESSASVPADSSSGTVPDTSEEAPPEEETPQYPYDYTAPAFFDIDYYYMFTPTAEISGIMEDGSCFELPSEDGYGVLQGSCTDGSYVYMFLQNQRAELRDGEFVVKNILYKVDMSTWEVVAKSEPLESLDHANGITYNSKTNQLVVTNGKPNRELISFMDPESLTVTGQITFSRDVGCISYNATRDQYVLRVAGTHQDKFVIADADFRELAYYEGVDTGQTVQGLDSDDDYIYILNTGISTSRYHGAEMMTVYDWDGNYRGVYRIGTTLENEGMFHTGGIYYMMIYPGAQKGAQIYKVNFDLGMLEYPGNG